jgi:hypothetical protein
VFGLDGGMKMINCLVDGAIDVGLIPLSRVQFVDQLPAAKMIPHLEIVDAVDGALALLLQIFHYSPEDLFAGLA